MNRRTSRLSEAVKEIMGELISTEIKDPRVGFVTVTGVDMTEDLRHAYIYISVMGDEKERRDTAIGLERAKKHLRHELGQRVRLRYVPEIEFRQDESIETGLRIDAILREIKEKERKDD